MKATSESSPKGKRTKKPGDKVSTRSRRDHRFSYLASLVDNLSDALISTDMDFNILEWNSAAENIYGWKSGEVKGHPLSKLVESEYVGTTQEQALQDLLEQGNWRGNIVQRRKDGTRFPVIASVSVVKDTSGKPIGFVAINRDNSDHLRAEKKLIQMKRLYATLSQVNQTIVRVTDLDELYQSICNVAVQFGQFSLAWVGLVNEETGVVVPKFAAGLDVTQWPFQTVNINRGKLKDGMIAKALRTSRVITIEDAQTDRTMQNLYDQYEKFAYHSSAAIPFRLRGKTIGIVSLISPEIGLFKSSEEIRLLEEMGLDISFAHDTLENDAERRETEKQLLLLNANLERRVAERTAELNQMNIELGHANRVKSEFLATMSHELRTPLNSILGLSESLLEQRRDALTDHQQQSLQLIESSGRHLLELINDVLDISKIEAGKLDFFPEVTEVNLLCRSSLAFVKEQSIRRSITVSYVENKTVPLIYADPRRLKQILINLLTNAVKFTPERGQVSLQVHANPEDDLIQFVVADNGIGIAPEDLKRLFQPFVQVDSKLNRKFEGTGLGLALVQKLTELHGGSVHVESEVGKGSRFTINLPLGMDIIARPSNTVPHGQRSTVERAQETTPSLERALERGPILLVEDNFSNILTVHEYLESHDFEVALAHDGLEALAKAAEIEPAIILMDIQMPVMDGLEAIRHLRADPRFKETPIIALTALAMPGDRERCFDAGANEYISKPASLKMLVKTIHKLLESKTRSTDT